MMLARSVLEEELVDKQYLLPTGVPVNFNLSHLSQDRQLPVRSICSSQVFLKNPGRTDRVEHDIVLKEGASVR